MVHPAHAGLFDWSSFWSRSKVFCPAVAVHLSDGVATGGKGNGLEPTIIFEGRTAKELGMLLTEGEAVPLSRLDHALYLGRELQKAERCLDTGEPYVQD